MAAVRRFDIAKSKVSRDWIFTKFGLWCRLLDLINCDKFWHNLFKGLKFTGDQNSNFPIGN